jgi:chromosome segregation ATPase
VTLARTESIAANESKKEAEEERDKLKKRVVDSERECKAMKEAMLALAEAERHRLKAIRRLESKLKRAKALLEEATNSAVDAEKTASALRNQLKYCRLKINCFLMRSMTKKTTLLKSATNTKNS